MNKIIAIILVLCIMMSMVACTNTIDQNNTEPIDEITCSTEPQTEPYTGLQTEEPTEPPVISEDWFDDALFIGDSRTVGLRAVERLGNADYFCKSSMSTFTALVWRASDRRFQDENLKHVLSNFKYKKIFIELGINECGYDHELVIDAYQDIIDLIREFQPNAAIIVQSVITVSREKATDKQFTLERVTNLNKLIYEMTQANDIFYLDTNEFAADEEGYLRSDLSNDGCHFHEIGSAEWINFIVRKSAELKDFIDMDN